MRKVAHAALIPLILALPANAIAGGFAVVEQSASAAGVAAAGGAAVARDASTVHYARTTGAVGATYRIRERTNLDIAYEYSHRAPARVNPSSAQAGGLSGTVRGESQVVAVQVALTF